MKEMFESLFFVPPTKRRRLNVSREGRLSSAAGFEKYSGGVATCTADSEVSQLDWRSVSTLKEPPKRRKATETYHDNDEWESHRGVIEELYTVYGLQDMSKKMEKEYGFKASPSQYKAKFSQWGISRYIKFTPKQLIYIAKEVVKRSGKKKGPTFRLNGMRLKSKNVERALNRNLEIKPSEDNGPSLHLKAARLGGGGLNGELVNGSELEIASITSKMSSCGLSNYTSSSRGVRVPWLAQLKWRLRKTGAPEVIWEDDENQSYPIPPAHIAKCLIKIADDDGKIGERFEPSIYSVSSLESRVNVSRKVFDPWFMNLEPFENCHKLLDRALSIVRGHETGVDFQVRGFVIPDETRLLLCSLHLTKDFKHGENFTVFRVDRVSQAAPNSFKIGCGLCGFSCAFEDRSDAANPNYDSGIAHREKYNVWPSEFLERLQCFMHEHSEHPQGKLMEEREGLRSLWDYVGEWHAADIASRDLENRIFRDSEIIDAGSDLAEEDRVSLSDILMPDLWCNAEGSKTGEAGV